MTANFYVNIGRPSEWTPLREIEPGLLIKFEIDNPGASHKVRAARHIVRVAMEAGHIVPGRRPPAIE